MSKRLVQWDLLRSLAMLFVVVCHSAAYLGPIRGVNTNVAIVEFALLCDPVFFTLSGYFAIRPLKGSYLDYIFNKTTNIIIPLLTYSLCLYVLNVAAGNADLTLSSCLGWCYGAITGNFWFIPCLIPFLALAPFLFDMFSALSDIVVKCLESLIFVGCVWGIVSSIICFLNSSPSAENFILLSTAVFPPSLVPGGYFVYFCLGYFLRREESCLKPRSFKMLVGFGLLSWAFCPVLSLLGYQRADPSYLWFPATVAIFLLFSRVDIRGRRVCAVISFLARHSYSVYFLQYTTIGLVFGQLNSLGLLDGTTALSGATRLGLQTIAVISSYALAVIIAVIVDMTLIRFTKKLTERVFSSLFMHLPYSRG